MSSTHSQSAGWGRKVLGVARWLRRDLRACLSLGFLLFLVGVAVFATVIAPHSPTAQNVNTMLLPPSGDHWLGTDDLGRDVLSRLIHGAPATLYASFLAVSIACLIGIPVGLIAGFVGGWLDDAISRVVDTLLSFPAIVLAIGVTGALGIGLTNGMISVGIVPNAIQPVIVQVTLLLAASLLAEASLSFLGLGVQPPQPSWGAMLARAYNYLEIAPEQMYAPGFAILLTALSFNALGESLRVALDPTMKHR